MAYNLKDDHVKSEKFRRDGAKYLCKKCKGKYFSKGDVEKCFDGHAAGPVEEKKEDTGTEKKPA